MPTFEVGGFSMEFSVDPLFDGQWLSGGGVGAALSMEFSLRKGGQALWSALSVERLPLHDISLGDFFDGLQSPFLISLNSFAVSFFDARFDLVIQSEILSFKH